MTEYISREATLDVIREVSERYADENLAEFAYNIVINIPATDVQPVGFVQNEVLNYLFNKEREAKSMPYSDVRQERIATLREVIRYVEGIGDTNG